MKRTKMQAEPGVFIKYDTIRDAHHKEQGQPEVFKANIGALIDAGYVVAVGESSIERTFDKSNEFKDWFDSLAKHE